MEGTLISADRTLIRRINSMVARPNYHNLSSEVFDALALHYRRWIAEHESDDIYAYVIYATALVGYFYVSVLTEQGLTQVASDYKTKYGYDETLEQLANDLRWSVADSPYCGDYSELFDPVSQRLGSMMPYVDSLDLDDPEFDNHIDTLYSILVSALNEFRTKVLRGAKRPMLYIDFGDMGDDERLMFIQECNDPESVDWYCTSIRKSTWWDGSTADGIEN